MHRTRFLLVFAAALQLDMSSCGLTSPTQFACNENLQCPSGYCCRPSGFCGAIGPDVCAASTVDAGEPDAGAAIDGGGFDAGVTTPDAGTDAGHDEGDAGRTDAGADAGTAESGDAGALDGGMDAGLNGIDGGHLDAGEDAGSEDAGSEDAGNQDAGNQDAGMADAGPHDGGASAVCGPSTCAANGLLICVSGACEPDLLWSEWQVPPDAPPDSEYDSSAANGTVLDTTTGLLWQQMVNGSPCPADGVGVCSFPDAQSYCRGLNLGGFSSGWRLPEVVELQSIVNRSRTDNSVSIDMTAFPNTQAGLFWANTFYKGGSSTAWVVGFGADSSIASDSTGAHHYVRCVRSPGGDVLTAVEPTAQLSAPAGRYSYPDGTVATADIVYDNVTHLTWERTEPSGIFVWSSSGVPGSAQSHCAGLNTSALGGFTSGWRLPSVNELLSIVDFTLADPTIDETAFPQTGSLYFWADIPYQYNGSTGTAWVVNFSDGYAGQASDVAGAPYWGAVRCVRSGM